MYHHYKNSAALFFLLCVPLLLTAQSVKIVTNHIGYEENKTKRAIVVSENLASIDAFQLINARDSKVVYSGNTIFSGPVDKWKNWLFWAIDFSDYKTPGTYRIQISVSGNTMTSYPFVIGNDVLEQATISDVIYYFKGQRCSGPFDKADHHLSFSGKKTDASTVDAHGGWYDATGDYGKHLSHLSFSTYFNPQQISFTVWSLFKSYELLHKKDGTAFRQYARRLLDEAMYGADFLTRMKTPDGSFYRSVSAPGAGKFAKDRIISADSKGFGIKKFKDDRTFNEKDDDWRSYEVSYRAGGGMAIAALALAATYDTTGDFSRDDYLRAAEDAFTFLEKNNLLMTNDGRENIVDDYCALTAATELYKASQKTIYKEAADKRAEQLMNRLSSWKAYHDYWRADDKDRPFFHAADAGLPLVSLLEYYPVANKDIQQHIREVIRRSLKYELTITHEVNNPFGYSRQLVQDTAGNRRSAFFFPHNTETAPWWQGEDARLASMATAARMAAALFNDNTSFHDSLESFALDQLNWILGLNPYDACMLQGTGHNNPAYGFFGSLEYTNAPGGIVNGITSGLNDEHDIDFNLPYSVTGKDYDWRWGEQWLPHASWYLLAISLEE